MKRGAVGFILIITPAWIFFNSFAAAGASGNEPFSFGVVPQQSASRIARLWTPFLQYLEASTGYVFGLKTAKNIPAFEDRVFSGEYDFAYMNPYHYTVFSRRSGYRAIAREQDKRIRGVIVVGRDSPIKDLRELSGRIAAFPAPAAFAATIIPLAALKKMDIRVEPKYVGSHDSVYLTVQRGMYPAGGGIPRTLNKMPGEVRDALRILWESPGFTPHAFAVHPRVPEAALEKTRTALVNMAKDPHGREALARLSLSAIGPASDADWDDVRALDISPPERFTGAGAGD